MIREITVADGIIYVPVPTIKRVAYLSEIARVQFTTWIDNDTAIVDTNGMDTYKIESILYCLDNVTYSPKFGVRLSDSFVRYFLYIIEENKRRREREEQERIKDEEARTAKHRLKYGCGWCENLKRIRFGHKCAVTNERCPTKMDESELAFELYKEEGTYQIPTPFPGEKCPYRKHLEEIKNGRNEEQPLAL